MISAASLSKYYPGKVLFEDLTFTMSKGERLGLVGRNGCGKSTLLKIIIGEIEPNSGQVVYPKGYKVGYLSQHLEFSKKTVLEECVQNLEIFEHYKAERVLQGLGFTSEGLLTAPEKFSGGYQLRINLAKCILAEPDLLILDEPTNYLDVLSLRWLKDYLLEFKGEVILITHDQYFMDQVITHTLGIFQTKGRKIKGASAKYYEQIKSDQEILLKSKANQEQKIKEMEKFVERFRSKASKATQAQSKLKAIEKIEIIDVDTTEEGLSFSFSYAPTPAKRLLKTENLSFSYDSKNWLYQNLSFELEPETRMAIIGQNGKGKTTLLRHIAQEIKNLDNEIYFHPQTKIGFYHQTNKKDLNLSLTVAEEIALTNPNLTLTEVRAICGAVMFTGDDALKKIGVLSGGEQARVLLGKVLAYPNNCLLLDEPSNHLDRDAVEKLAQEIDKFKGGVVFVTHHEGLLHKLANKIVYFKKDQAHYFNGTYQDFLDKVGWQEGELKPQSAPLKKESGKDHQEQRKKLNKLQSKIEKLEKEIEILELSLTASEADLEKIILGDDSSKSQKMSEHYALVGKTQTQIQIKYEELEVVLAEKELLEKN